MEQELEKIGFKKNEIKVYLYLAKNPSVPASQISKKTGLYRPYVYDTLQRLIDKGLVSYAIKSGKKYFTASPPDKVISEIDMQENELEKKRKIAEKLIPRLTNIFKEKEEDYSIEVFEGKEGLKTYYEFLFRLVRQGKLKDAWSYGGRGDVFQTLEYYFPHFIKKIQKAGFFKRVNYRLMWDHSKKGSKEHKRLDRHIDIRFLPKEFSMPAGGVVFMDFFVIVKPEQPALLIRIRNKEIAESFRNLFKGLWSISSK